ncbi:MAG: hypothetical protein GDA36_14040 [Rhodobacteraceae bacterium]|nr:hypothetical protein [Paracoccaceae bacterium]
MTIATTAGAVIVKNTDHNVLDAALVDMVVGAGLQDVQEQQAILELHARTRLWLWLQRRRLILFRALILMGLLAAYSAIAWNAQFGHIC